MIQRINHLNLQQEIGLLKIWVEILLKINKNKLKISTDLKSKYGQKLIDHAKQSATNALKTASKRALDDTTNQPFKFRTRNWAETNDESRGDYNDDDENNDNTYDINSNIKFKTSTIRSSLCDYSDAYILVEGAITVPNTTAAGAAVNNTNKKVVFNSI